MQKKFTLKTSSKELLADTITPVNIYLKLRDVFAGTILLESSDYHGHENSLSYICFEPMASFEVKGDILTQRYPDGDVVREPLTAEQPLTVRLERFCKSFDLAPGATKYAHAGLFGYITFDAVRYFEDVALDLPDILVPDVLYKLYRYVIVVDHFSNVLSLFEHTSNVGEDSKLESIEQLILSNRVATYVFRRAAGEQSNYTDEEFLNIIEKGKEHCYRGDVFQIVLSRRFQCGFKGDEFNVYRALRSINPSPYLFYFDYGTFKLMGSSPEAQLQVKGGSAYIYPIAGTFRRSGKDQEDAALAARLSADEKENAEHVMLVDLARNDMSRHAAEVKVEVFREVQFYSHVIHLVSKVSGRLPRQVSSIDLAAATFPAGTLSGAPKHMAVTLINKYENVNRSFYGGAIGFLGFDGTFNHAIMIRTFLSRHNTLTYQAGAGIVSKSDAPTELQEVNNKLGALRRAIDMAEKIS